MLGQHFRKDPLEGELLGESQTSGCSLKRCSHAPATRSSRRRPGCMTDILDNRSFAESRFLNWVSYDRSLAGPSQITDDERLRCPIIWCRRRFNDQNELLEHVFRCAHYSDGLYWCFHCQREESFTSCQCKHCQVPQFDKERLSVRVKRLFRSLGSKSNQKDHETLGSPGALKAASGNTDKQCAEYLPLYGEVPPMAVEMNGNEVSRELEAYHICEPAELNGLSPAELHTEATMSSSFKQDVLGSNMENPTHLLDNEITGFAPHRANLKDVQSLALSPFDVHEPPSQFRMDEKFKLDIPTDGPSRLQSPVSPENAEWAPANYAGAISESPTDTDFSGLSLFSRSFNSDISPPSTRSSTMQSVSQSSVAVEKSPDHWLALPIMQDLTNEMPNNITKEEFSCPRRTNSIGRDSFHSVPERDLSALSSRKWLTPNDLLNNFWKVLNLHVVESSQTLKKLMNIPVISELLSMTASTIAFMGFETWQQIHKGYFPTTIAHLYSVVHVAYACAIVIYDGQVESQLSGLFTQSLSIGTRSLSEEDKWIYMSIAWSTWSPPVEAVHLHPLAPSKSTAQLVPSSSEQSCAKGKAPLHMDAGSERANQLLHKKEVPITVDLHSNEENKLLDVLNLFLDIFEGTTIQSVAGNLSYGSLDENFIRTVKENVTVPLIEGHFQPGPSLEAFIKVVLQIDALVSSGQITTIRQVEVGLKWAGKSIAQSMELYGIFSSRVKDLCSAVSYQLCLDPIRQNESLTEGIETMLNSLEITISSAKRSSPEGEYKQQSEIGLGSSSLRSEYESSLLGNTLDSSIGFEHLQRYHLDLIADTTRKTCKYRLLTGNSDNIQAELCRRSAVKRKRPLSSSSHSTPETGPSLSPSTSSNNVSENLENEYSCSICGFRPTGERRWHKRTVKRHIAALHVSDKKSYFCEYKGCDKSFTRPDNRVAHFRAVHKRNRRQFNPDVQAGTTTANAPPKSADRNRS